jgi:glycosyltransferase involved in cell wall biosynthesis
VPNLAITVLYLISTLADCGPVNVLWGIVRHLDRRHYHPVIATISAEPQGSSLQRFQGAGIEIRQMNLSRAESLLFGKNRIRKLVAETGASVVHCHGIRAALLGAGVSRNCRVIATLHCDIGQYYRLAYGRFLGNVMGHLEYAALKRCAAVIAVSDNVSEAAGNHGIQTAIVRNGIDLDIYCPPRGPKEATELRTRFGWPTDSLIILHTGTISEGKHPVEVIQAFLDSHAQENRMLIFAGDGPLRARCMQVANHSKQIVFLGRRGDVADLLKATDVLVSNSESEGFPLALLEGCASGVQVLASDIPAHRKLQDMFPEQFKLFEEGNKYSLVAALSSISESSRARISPSEAGLRAISDNNMSRSYCRLYSSSEQSINKHGLHDLRR